MRNLICLLSIFIVVALTGCAAVFTEQPVGDEIVNLDPATWQGTWRSGGIVLLTTVQDSEKGQLQAAWMERGSAGAKFETVTGSVRRAGEIMYLNMENEPDEAAGAAADSGGEIQADGQDKPEFFWARIQNDGQQAVLWWPNVEQIRTAVHDGKLPGVVRQDEDVVLGQLEASHLELINSAASNLLQWQQPVTFIRIGD